MRKRVVVLEKCLAVGLGGIVSDGCPQAAVGHRAQRLHVIAGLGGRAITRASLTRLFEDAGATSSSSSLSSISTRRRRQLRARARGADRAAPGPTAEAILRRLGTVASRYRAEAPGALAMERRRVKFYQTGTFTVGNRLLAEDAALGAGEHAIAPTRSIPAIAPARAAAKRSARAMRSMRRCGRPATSLSRSTRPAASKCSRRPIRRLRGRSRGSIRCSATPPRSRPASPRRSGAQGHAPTCASSRRAATAARPTSASAACPACSSATTTCSTSATTTRRT